MKILILGGTGAMGVHLVKLLSDDKHNIIVTSRSEQRSTNNVKYIIGNAKDTAFLTTILREHWDVIIDFMVYTTTSFQERVNILLKATSQYIFLSSSRVYTDSKYPIKETSERLLETTKDQLFLSTDEYSLAKARQENILRDSENKNWTIIRPYITYDSYRLQLGILEKEDWLYRALQGRTIVFSNEINSKLTTMTFGFDVACGIKSIVGQKEALGEIFHITSEKPLVWNDILNIYLDVLEKHLGKRPKVLLDNLDNFLKIHPAVYQVKYDRLYNRQFDNSKIGKYINISDFTKTAEGLRNCLTDFLKHPKFKQINWRREALKDRKTKEFANLSEIKGFKQKIKYLLYRLITN